MQCIDLGLIRYNDALAIQKERVEAVRNGAEDTLYLLEHPRVITLGRNGGAENLHVAPALLNSLDVELVQSSRGGNITCHFPGQLVAYPIFRVAPRVGGLKGFFHDMEEVAIRTVAHFGIKAGRQEGRPGVWIENRKICSIGIAMRHWTSYHGLALNVARDVSLFELITLCGLPDATPTSICAECHDDSITVQEVKDVCAGKFREVFTNSPVVTD